MDEPRPNSPEDLGWTPEAIQRPPAPIIPRIERRTSMTAKTTPPEPKDEGPRGFAPFLQQVDDGDLHIELSRTLQELVGELHTYAEKYRRAGKGTLTIALNFSVEGNGVIHVMGDVKTKTPKTPRAPTAFFRTPGNNLSIENPRQTKLPLREVPQSEQRPRDVNPDAAPPRAL